MFQDARVLSFLSSLECLNQQAQWENFLSYEQPFRKTNLDLDELELLLLDESLDEEDEEELLLLELELLDALLRYPRDLVSSGGALFAAVVFTSLEVSACSVVTCLVGTRHSESTSGGIAQVCICKAIEWAVTHWNRAGLQLNKLPSGQLGFPCTVSLPRIGLRSGVLFGLSPPPPHQSLLRTSWTSNVMFHPYTKQPVDAKKHDDFLC